MGGDRLKFIFDLEWFIWSESSPRLWLLPYCWDTSRRVHCLLSLIQQWPASRKKEETLKSRVRSSSAEHHCKEAMMLVIPSLRGMAYCCRVQLQSCAFISHAQWTEHSGDSKIVFSRCYLYIFHGVQPLPVPPLIVPICYSFCSQANLREFFLPDQFVIMASAWSCSQISSFSFLITETFLQHKTIQLRER